MKKEITGTDFVSKIGSKFDSVGRIFGVLIILMIILNLLDSTISTSQQFLAFLEASNLLVVLSIGGFVWLKWVEYKKNAKWSVVAGLLIAISVTAILTIAYVVLDDFKNERRIDKQIIECKQNCPPDDYCLCHSWMF